MGFAVVAFPTVMTFAYAKAAMEAAEHLLRTGGIAGLEPRMVDFDAFHDLVGLPALRAAEERAHRHEE
mgnify:FL=1